MAKKRTPREELERALFVSFVLPDKAKEMLDEHEKQIARNLAAFLRQFWTTNSAWSQAANRIDPDKWPSGEKHGLISYWKDR